MTRDSNLFNYAITIARTLNFVNCAPNRIRTCDLVLKRDLLYQLSYERVNVYNFVE